MKPAQTCNYVMVAFGECDTRLLLPVCPIPLFYSWSQLVVVASRVPVCTHIIEPVFRLKNIEKPLIFGLEQPFHSQHCCMGNLVKSLQHDTKPFPAEVVHRNSRASDDRVISAADTYLSNLVLLNRRWKPESQKTKSHQQPPSLAWNQMWTWKRKVLVEAMN